VAKDVALEIRQLVQRGLEHHERGRLHDALSDWETALRLGPRDLQAKRLVDFAQQRANEDETGKHRSRSRRDTLESPIPQFLATLTERQAERQADHLSVPEGPVRDGPTAKMQLDDWNTLGPIWHALSGEEDQEGPADGTGAPQITKTDQSLAPDTLDDLHVHADDIRASTNELIGECRSALNDNRAEAAALAAELALHLSEQRPSAGIDDPLEPSRALFERAFRASMGNPHGCPIRAIPAEELAEHGLDQGAAFLMSRMDGMTSLADIIDSSGMPRFDAARILSALRRAKAIDVLPPLP
jgi:hypothetical protein